MVWQSDKILLWNIMFGGINSLIRYGFIYSKVIYITFWRDSFHLPFLKSMKRGKTSITMNHLHLKTIIKILWHQGPVYRNEVEGVLKDHYLLNDEGHLFHSMTWNFSSEVHIWVTGHITKTGNTYVILEKLRKTF